MFWRIRNFFGIRRIDKWILKQSRDELRTEHAPGCSINRCFRNFALLHLLDEAWISAHKWKFDVHARFKRKFRSLFLCRYNVMHANQFIDPEIIGHDHPIEAPLVPENVVE